MINKKKIIALVPARGGSKGIKFKNLKKINNKTLIEITSDFIDKSRIFDNKILNSDNKKILRIGQNLKFIKLVRPKKLSGDRISDYTLIKYSLRKLEQMNIFGDYLVYLQPTSPKRNINHFLKSLKIVIKKNLDGAWSVSRVNKKYHPLKILINKKGKLKLYFKSGKKIIARQMLDNVFIRNGAFYIFSIKQLKKQNTIYLKNTLISESKYKTINIDTVTDLKNARKIF